MIGDKLTCEFYAVQNKLKATERNKQIQEDQQQQIKSLRQKQIQLHKQIKITKLKQELAFQTKTPHLTYKEIDNINIDFDDDEQEQIRNSILIRDEPRSQDEESDSYDREFIEHSPPTDRMARSIRCFLFDEFEVI